MICLKPPPFDFLAKPGTTQADRHPNSFFQKIFTFQQKEESGRRIGILSSRKIFYRGHLSDFTKIREYFSKNSLRSKHTKFDKTRVENRTYQVRGLICKTELNQFRQVKLSFGIFSVILEACVVTKHVKLCLT